MPKLDCRNATPNVAERAPLGQFHLLRGPGHLQLLGHRPGAVNACIRGDAERDL